MKKLFISLLLVFVVMTGQAQTKVWNDIVTSFSNASIAKVTQVAFYNNRTELSFHIDYRAGQWISINDGTYLLADGKQYAIKDATVLKLGEQYTLATDTLDFVLIFERVPQNVQSVYMVEPNGWQIGNIRSASILPLGIIDTYWRNEATGDWLIGFAKDHVIYQNAVWDIANIKEKKDAYTFTLLINNMPGVRCAFLSKDFSLKAKVVKVSKMKKGLRTITIDDGKPVTCSPITTASLPDYPTKDTRTGFVDNGFRMGDSATIIGWLKNMPPGLLEQNPEFTVHYDNILTGSQESVYTRLDSLGRFTLKMPLMNSSEVYIDWGRSTVGAVFEPGKTYFLLHDFWTGQKLWMGDDVRVQNELLQPAALSRARSYGAGVPYDEDNVDLMAYWAQCDSVRLQQEADLKAVQESHPTLSQRFLDYEAGYYRMRQGRNMMQARFCVQNSPVPKEYVDYVGENFWKTAPKPYTLYSYFTTLNRDFIDQVEHDRGGVDINDVLRRFEESGQFVTNDEEKAILEKYNKEFPLVMAKINAAETNEEKEAIAEAFNTSETVTKMDVLLQRSMPLMYTYGFQHLMDIVDSLGGDRKIRDIILAQRMIQQIDATRMPLDSSIIAFAVKNIQLPFALTAVKTLNDHYLAIENREFDKLVLKSSDDLANLSEGEALLKKILEPYKGKFVLLDVWGTWCGPCKEALSHSAEEYERLKEYNIEFLYLANNSPQTAWENVIKEYNVSGDNVAHYNLPSDQQRAIEHYLNVTGYPTYKLFNRDGNLLDLNVDARDLENIARLLDQMK